VSSTVSANKLPVINDTIRDELEVLFEECVDLANYLKRKARQTHRGEQLSASGRILLQSLQLNGPQTVPALAHLRSTSRQNIQVLVDRLAAAGYVEFVVNPGHRRSDYVQLTGAGQAMLDSANEREAGVLASLMPHTSESEVSDAAELLRKLRQLMAGERKRRKPGPQSARDEAAATLATVHAPVEADEELPVSLR
jgi:DNA-binding MarR family transcriptional regulator